MEIIKERKEVLVQELKLITEELNKAQQAVNFLSHKTFSLQERINELDELISLDEKENFEPVDAV